MKKEEDDGSMGLVAIVFLGLNILLFGVIPEEWSPGKWTGIAVILVSMVGAISAGLGFSKYKAKPKK